MPMVKGKCSACGAPFHLDVAQPFAEGAIAGALCPACTNYQFLDGGGAFRSRRHFRLEAGFVASLFAPSWFAAVQQKN